jgi:hypothetical protein
VALLVSLDDDEKNKQFERLDTTQTTTILTAAAGAIDVEESGQAVLAGAEADYALPMGKVDTGALLFIESDQDLTVKLDGEAVGHTLKKPAAGVNAKALITTEFSTAPLITNGHATEEAEVTFLIAGTKA